MLLGGLCGLTFWEDTNLTMAPLTQSLSRRACFPDQGRGGHRGGAAGTPWWLGRSCHPMQLALQLARPSRPNSVHKRPKTARRGPILPFVYTIAIPRPPTTQAHSPTVYTNAPKRRREAVLANLCTLLRPRAVRNGVTAQQCTQMPQNGAERPDPPICVHYCDPKVTRNPSPQPNSVHKCPKTARRGRFSQSVYTPALPQLHA